MYAIVEFLPDAKHEHLLIERLFFVSKNHSFYRLLKYKSIIKALKKSVIKNFKIRLKCVHNQMAVYY